MKNMRSWAAAAVIILAGSLAWAHSEDDHGGSTGGSGDVAAPSGHHSGPAAGDDHDAGDGRPAGDGHHELMREMRQMHEGHDHEHDFEAMERMDPDQMRRIMNVMQEVGLAMQPMNASRGRVLFVEKGCIVCHSASGVGGDLGPSFNAQDMPEPMNAYEFAARMWRGAEAMVAMQQQLFGEQIELNGQELADIIAFAHDEAEQRKLAATQIPQRFRELMPQ